MTIVGEHATCDGCGAVVPVWSDKYPAWQHVQWKDGPGADLCPDCQEKRDRGWLAHGLVVECSQCGRNSMDHRGMRWWRTLDRGDVCDDCH